MRMMKAILLVTGCPHHKQKVVWKCFSTPLSEFFEVEKYLEWNVSAYSARTCVWETFDIGDHRWRFIISSLSTQSSMQKNCLLLLCMLVTSAFEELCSSWYKYWCSSRPWRNSRVCLSGVENAFRFLPPQQKASCYPPSSRRIYIVPAIRLHEDPPDRSRESPDVGCHRLGV